MLSTKTVQKQPDIIRKKYSRLGNLSSVENVKFTNFPWLIHRVLSSAYIHSYRIVLQVCPA